MNISFTASLVIATLLHAPLYAQKAGVADAFDGSFRKHLLAVLGEDRARTWGLPTRLEIDPNRNRLYLTEPFGEISIFDCETLNRIQSFAAHSQRCLDVALIDGGKQLVSVATDGDIRLWGLQGAEPKLLDTYSMSDSDEPVWLKISRAFKSKLFAVRSDKLLVEWQAHNGHVCDVTFSPDGNNIASVGWDHQTKIWNINYEPLEATAGLQLENKAHTDILRSVAYSPSGKFLASCGEDGLVLLWDLNAAKLAPTVFSYPDLVSKSNLISKTIGSLQFSKTEEMLLTASGSGRVTQWNTSNGQITQSWQLPGWIWQARYSPDENSIATANNDGTVYIFKNPLRD